MVKITDTMDAEAAAEKLLQGRMDYVRQAIDARQALETARAALRDAERADTAAYQAAVKNGGWSEDELKKIGLSQPEKIKRVQRKSREKSQSGRETAQRESTSQSDEMPQPEQMDARQNQNHTAG